MKIRHIGLTALLLLGGCASADKVSDLRAGNVGWVSYPSSVENNVTLRGHLTLPEKLPGPFPAMIIAHASGGPDARDERWARLFADNGIAAFRIDYFGPRGITADSGFQPTPYHDAHDAARLLATHPRIDPRRIGIIGFSRGAVIALHTSNTPASSIGAHGFTAHVALYPSCRFATVRRGGSEAPVLVLLGRLDNLEPVSVCESMVAEGRERGRKVELKIYDGAHHGWDGDYNGVWYHRAINVSYDMRTNEAVTRQSREDVLRFLKSAFGM